MDVFLLKWPTLTISGINKQINIITMDIKPLEQEMSYKLVLV